MKTPAYRLSACWSGLILIASILSITIITGACNKPVDSNDPSSTSTGPRNTTFPMPPLSASVELGWVDANSQRARLVDYRGKVLVLDFYATWCQPCRQSIPRLNELQTQYGRDGLQIVGLNVGGPDDRIKVSEFARELSILYPLGFPDKALTDLFLSDDQTIPQTFVFTRAGQLTKRFIGYEKSTSDELETVIKIELQKNTD